MQPDVGGKISGCMELVRMRGGSDAVRVAAYRKEASSLAAIMCLNGLLR
jgi:hypothetical protein